MERSKLITATIFSLALVGCGQSEEKSGPKYIPDQYIVVLNKDAAEVSARNSGGFQVQSVSAQGILGVMAQNHGLLSLRLFSRVLKGGVYKMSADKAEELRADPRVAYVEQDQVVQLKTTQADATWGLDRVDQEDLPLDSEYTYSETASSVNAYVIDTGIKISHDEFNGRAQHGFDAVDDDFDATDCNGHGTHVAGTIGGSTYGIAKDVNLIGVRVLNCFGSGTLSGVIAGIEWVTKNHVAPAVANMSLGGGASQAIDDALKASIEAGVTYVVAAGNSNASACNASPARVDSAITVGSTTDSDQRSSFSNYGSCVDIFAPGSQITSAWINSDSATNTIDGTSMASPHVAGVAALYLAQNPFAAPSEVMQALLSGAVSDSLGGLGAGSPNLLLNTGFLDGEVEEPEVEAPCEGCELTEGSLSGRGDVDEFLGDQGQRLDSGELAFYLEGAEGTDFDLYLYKKMGRRWRQVARSISYSSSEKIVYPASSGKYRLKVRSYRGSGDYQLWAKLP